MEEERSIFTLTLISEGDTIKVHATHYGEGGFLLAAGLSLVDHLSSIEDGTKTTGAYTFPASAWIQ